MTALNRRCHPAQSFFRPEVFCIHVTNATPDLAVVGTTPIESIGLHRFLVHDDGLFMDAMASIYVFALWAWPMFSANSSAPVRQIKKWTNLEKSGTTRSTAYNHMEETRYNRTTGFGSGGSRMFFFTFSFFVCHVSIAPP